MGRGRGGGGAGDGGKGPPWSQTAPIASEMGKTEPPPAV